MIILFMIGCRAVTFNIETNEYLTFVTANIISTTFLFSSASLPFFNNFGMCPIQSF